MEYPTYKNKLIQSKFKLAMVLTLASFLVTILLPWLIYLQATGLFLLMTYYMVKKYRGFKAITGFFFGLMLMLTLIDLADGVLTWSINQVLPAFIISLTSLQVLLLVFRKKAWHYHYTIHIMLTLISLGLLIASLLGLISSVVSIVAMSFGLFSVVLAWILKRGQYWQGYVKYCHL